MRVITLLLCHWATISQCLESLPSIDHSSTFLSFLDVSWRHLVPHSSMPEKHMSLENSWFTVEQGNVLFLSLGATCFWECHGNTHSVTRSWSPGREFSAVSSCLFWFTAQEFPSIGKAHCNPHQWLWAHSPELRRKEGLLQSDLWVWVLNWGSWEFSLNVYVKLWAYGLTAEGFFTSSWLSNNLMTETYLRISALETAMALWLLGGETLLNFQKRSTAHGSIV